VRQGATTLTLLPRSEEIHHQYLKAGRDIIETNTFNAQAVSRTDYAKSFAYEMNKAAAEIAVRGGVTAADARKPRFVGASARPTARPRCRPT
jgi:5-methyltetrahydrofolate--homocysteine methyltransferase